MFVEKSTIFNLMKNEIPSDWEVIAFPPDYPIRKIIFKESIPTIEILKSASGLIKGARVRTTRQKYVAKIRATQRDRRWAKILLINLCNGVFPKIDKVI